MLPFLKKQLQSFIEVSLKQSNPSLTIPAVQIEEPADTVHGDFSCNIALKVAKAFKKSPLDCAADFQKVLKENLPQHSLKKDITKIEVKKPGFINFFLSPEALYAIVLQILRDADNYGRLNLGDSQKIQIEFVSANPTGPLSVAHARQAAVGDALGNILNFLGYQVTKEFYVNDEGNQINILGRSIELRAREILGEKVDFPEEGYQGDYIREMAQIFIKENSIKKKGDLEEVGTCLPAGREQQFRKFGVEYLLAVIKKELDDFGVHFDVWAHQSQIATLQNIEFVLNQLKQKEFVYEHEGALWFKSTSFGDDKDRVVKKSDGSYTYLTPDIVYHKNKFERGFKRVINIWGPDHHGYIPRLKSSVQALGVNPEALDILIVQLATITRAGVPLSMSTRRGQYISLREVMEEVGRDAARFFFLMRNTNQHLDFDLELAKKETPENPVFYIQYAHARIHSINEKAKEVQLTLPTPLGFSLLKEEEETALMKKLGAFPETLLFCSKELDPFSLAAYLHELSISFHKFYDCRRVIDEANRELSLERLSLVNAVKIVLSNGLRLLGVSSPEKM